MASGTKRLPRAVREQQMLDAAIAAFSANGFADTSMDVIAAEAKISKPMLYLYYGSKDELFSACIARESGRFMESMAEGFDPSMRQKDQARTLVREFLRFVYQNAESWRLLYRVAIGTTSFAHIVTDSRTSITAMITDLIRRGTTTGASDLDFELTAVALVGAGEAVADRIAEGDIDLERATDLLLGITWRGLRGVGVAPDAVGDEI
ncbi:TetR/AcrR family transcriptional regulator [Gordonia sp. (in: high G+C Gram-positive bacteria)]|uniref:TetR/AcrR family transcriptional regulator n=1 Tax=Gordonia sp. (in: high G+C Gram-positive bacteria) TaxID=84139 RepID=UPI0016AD5CCD|nr:TetR/AcrR family transcriptional regulator [Gordonia sp. (in: high G+C Gram-positive bacteria)]NLG47856.1 TetR/AcrR family transcriptional regulator [Gordonia sp. (in: high G+C Gram-positive bacteria)]